MAHSIPLHKTIKPNDVVGGLTVLGMPFRTRWGSSRGWYCVVRCECNATFSVPLRTLARRKPGCVCMTQARIGGASKTHGKSGTRLYSVWKAMRGRCRNPNYSTYKDYGGRGIRVCDEWDKSFLPFEKWAISNGWRQGLEIDRIDNNGGYCPENCRVTTRTVNLNNMRSNRVIVAFGETKTLSQWAADARCRVTYDGLYNRIYTYGYTPEDAISLPPNPGIKYRG